MVGSPPSKRDYKRERLQESPTRKKQRAARNRARYAKAKELGVSPTSIKGDVGHKKPLSKGGTNSKSNIAVQSKKHNRSTGGALSSGTKGKTFKKRNTKRGR